MTLGVSIGLIPMALPRNSEHGGGRDQAQSGFDKVLAEGPRTPVSGDRGGDAATDARMKWRLGEPADRSAAPPSLHRNGLKASLRDLLDAGQQHVSGADGEAHQDKTEDAQAAWMAVETIETEPAGSTAPEPAETRPAAPPDQERGDRPALAGQPAERGTADADPAPRTGAKPSADAAADTAARQAPSGPAPLPAAVARADAAGTAPAPAAQPDNNAQQPAHRPAPAAQPAEQAPSGRVAAQSRAAEAATPRATVLGFATAPAPVLPPQLTPTAAGLVTAMEAEPAWRAAATEAAAIRPGQSHGSVSTLRIQLNPAELGMVTARLTATGQQLEIEIRVESNDARQRLAGDSDAIVKALRAIGFDIDRVTIQQAPQGGAAIQQHGSQGRDAFGPGQGQQEGTDAKAGGRNDRGGDKGGDSGRQATREAPADRAGGSMYI